MANEFTLAHEGVEGSWSQRDLRAPLLLVRDRGHDPRTQLL
jgi:hypothetical protein